jgi:hypothetical protein
MAQSRSAIARRRPKELDGAAHLATYLKENDLSYSKFGESVGCTKAHVCGLVSRKSKPSLQLAKRMEQKTEGKIPQGSWA